MARRRAAPTGVVGRLQHLGFYRGVLGRSRGWLFAWAAFWLLGRLRGRTGGEVLLSEPLKPGQRIMIANGRATIGDAPLPVRRGRGGRLKPVKAPRPSRAERRAARRS